MNLRKLLDDAISKALTGLTGTESPAIVKRSGRPEFGDYQANGVMGAAKKLKTKPRDLAQQLVDQLDLSPYVSKLEIAGPGFINIHLDKNWCASQLLTNGADSRLGVSNVASAQNIVVDYSSPNLAKEMHVGHLRSSIIGDAVVRILEFLGHNVLRQNHVGDWGTQFGMLIAYMEQLDDNAQNGELADLEGFYRASKKRFDEDSEFASRARQRVVDLQAGDAKCLQLWQRFIDVSLSHSEAIYKRLGVSLNREHVKPESAYNDDLSQVIVDLDQQQLLAESDGAKCVFMDEFVGKDGDPLPTIVQKSDGGYLYATTDLAAMRYRNDELQAQRILYFVDARQSLHLNQVFAVAKKAKFVNPEMQLEHLAFGTMMGEDGKPFKTRSGEVVKLEDLLIEAVQRAEKVVASKNPDLAEQQRRQIAETVGIAAVKYADLSKNRISDYVFNWDSMLALEGNTAPYIQYAYARICSIFRRAEYELQNQKPVSDSLILEANAERALAVKLLQLQEILEQVSQDCFPNTLCQYLYELASSFMSFFEACPVLKAETQALKLSRLQLCQHTANTLALGLNLLGINVLTRM